MLYTLFRIDISISGQVYVKNMLLTAVDDIAQNDKLPYVGGGTSQAMCTFLEGAQL